MMSAVAFVSSTPIVVLTVSQDALIFPGVRRANVKWLVELVFCEGLETSPDTVLKLFADMRPS